MEVEMDVVLYLLIVLCGCIIPFFIMSDDKLHAKMIFYGLTVIVLGLFFAMVKLGIAGIPSFSFSKNIFLGFATVCVAMMLAKVNRIINYKPRNPKKFNRTKKPAKDHKAAS